MSRHLLIPLALSINLVTGCGGGEESVAVAAPRGSTTGPHGGIAVPLPGDKGYAEVVVERTVPRSRTARPTSNLAIYFLDNELRSPLSPLPANVAVKAVLPTGDSPTSTLNPEPVSGDPLGASRHVSAMGDYDYDELFGEITATLDGQDVSVPFAFR